MDMDKARNMDKDRNVDKARNMGKNKNILGMVIDYYVVIGNNI